MSLELVFLGNVDGRPLMHYRAGVEVMVVGLISFPVSVSPAGRKASPTIHIAHRSYRQPTVLSIVRLMASQDRSPLVYFETVGRHLEVGVLFRASVSTEMLGCLKNVGGTWVDLSQVGGELQVDLLVAAKTKLPLPEGEKLLTLFGGRFKIVVGSGDSWEGEVSSYKTEQPGFMPHV